MDEYRERIMGDVDLCRPLRLSSIQALLEVCRNERASKVLDLIIGHAEGTSDGPNSTTNNNPTVEMIINQLPANTIPLEWILKHTPSMMPRFFSIVSMDDSFEGCSLGTASSSAY